MTVRIARITAEPIELADHIAAVSAAAAGAISVFIGTVRDSDPDAVGEVVALEYSAHPDAGATIERLAAGVDGPDLLVAVSHRVGRLGIGDAAVVIAIGSGHRDAAFVACRELIESIKLELPVWKRQVVADGSTAWKGLGG